MQRTIEISPKTILYAALLIFGLWLTYQIRDIILILFVSLILMSALNPFVDKLEKRRVPRSLAIVVVYLLFWGLISSILAIIVPPFVDQSGRLIRLLPEALDKIEFFNSHQQEISREVLTRLGSVPEGLIKITVSVFGNLLTIFTTLVIAFYLLLERKNLNKYLILLLGPDKPEKAAQLINQIESRLGNWVRGELVLMTAVGTMTYLGLLILGVDIALPLAVLAGLLEIVPNIGPTLSAIPAVLIALTMSPLSAFATIALYFLVQTLENNFLVPKIMQKAVGFNPLITILGLMVGFKIAGPAGAVLAIPTLIVVQVIATEVFSSRRFEGLTHK